MRSKWLAVLLCLAALLCLVTLVACDEETDCTHADKEWVDEILATCTADGTVGHYVCNGCQKTFDKDGKAISDLSIPAAHSPEDTWSTADGKHYHACTKCDEKLDLTDCSGGEATCTERAKCSVCAKEYGPEPTHKLSAEWSFRDNKHYHACENCDEIFDEASCTGGTATCTEKAKCSVCQHAYGAEPKHSPATEWSFADNKHYHACANCSVHLDEAPCSGGTATCQTLAKCAVCQNSYGTNGGHVYELDKYDDDFHWEECLCGEKKTLVRHVYSSSRVTPPTCTEGGYTTYFCECGHSYTDNETPATGHSYADTLTFEGGYHWYAATCGCEGEKKGYARHELHAHVTDPTCTVDGYTVYTCECGYMSEPDDIVPATGHSVAVWNQGETVLVDATRCAYSVHYSGECTVCGQTGTKTETVNNHTTYEKIVTSATCREAGQKSKFCSSEACVFHDTPLDTYAYEDAEAHVWTEDPGRSDETKTVYNCLFCNATKTQSHGGSANISGSDLGQTSEVEIANPNGSTDGSIVIGLGNGIKDTFGGQDVSISAGTLTDGEKQAAMDRTQLSPEDKQKLAGCDIFEFTFTAGGNNVSQLEGVATIRIPYTLQSGDNPDSIIVWYISDGTLTPVEAVYSVGADGKGYVTFTTTHFSYYTVDSIDPAEICEKLEKHDEEHVHVVAPTCTTGGYTVCLRCGQQIEGSAVPALGHTLNAELVRPASCSQNGAVRYTCSDCGLSYEVVIPATGHYHVAAEQITATCKTAGKVTYRCVHCGDTYRVTTPMLAHTYHTHLVAPTCQMNGYTEKTCMACGDVVRTGVMPAVAHTASTVWYTDKDSHYHICTSCGERMDESAHVPGPAATEQTAQLCTVCGYTIAPPVQHVHVLTKVEAIAPTCTESGNILYYVCACGEWFADEAAQQKIVDHASVIADATGHSARPTPYVEPTCTSEGYTAGVWCDDCEVYLRGHITIAKYEHDYLQIVTAPTCEQAGSITYRCAHCGDTEGMQAEPIAALGHEYRAFVTAPTCEEGGYTSYVCTRCDHTTTGNETAPLGHRFVSVLTATEEGHFHACVRCDETTAVEAHIPDYPEATTEHGVKCAKCNYVIAEAIAHTHAAVEKFAAITPTCTQQGRIAYYVCSCGEWFADRACTVVIYNRGSVILSATGHAPAYLAAQQPTCEDIGFTAGVFCNTCGEWLSGHEELAPKGHVEVPGYNDSMHWVACFTCGKTLSQGEHACRADVTVPTCEKGGFTVYTCDCGYTYTGDVTAPLGHAYGDWSFDGKNAHVRVCANDGSHVEREVCIMQAVVTPPTCEEMGYTTFTCPTCGRTVVDQYVPAHGHRYGKWTHVGGDVNQHVKVCSYDETHKQYEDCAFDSTTVAPTCTEEGYTLYSCSVCDNHFETDFIPALGHMMNNYKCVRCGELDESVQYYFYGRRGGEMGGGYQERFYLEDGTLQLFIYREQGETTPAERYTYYWVKEDNCLFSFGNEAHTYDAFEACYEILKDGSLTRYVCDLMQNRFHQYIETSRTPATCTTAGSYTEMCRYCGYGATYVLTPKGHSYENGACTVCGKAEPTLDEGLRKQTLSDMKKTLSDIEQIGWQVSEKDMKTLEKLYDTVENATDDDSIYAAKKAFDTLVEELRQANAELDNEALEALRADVLAYISNSWRGVRILGVTEEQRAIYEDILNAALFATDRQTLESLDRDMDHLVMEIRSLATSQFPDQELLSSLQAEIQSRFSRMKRVADLTEDQRMMLQAPMDMVNQAVWLIDLQDALNAYEEAEAILLDELDETVRYRFEAVTSMDERWQALVAVNENANEYRTRYLKIERSITSASDEKAVDEALSQFEALLEEIAQSGAVDEDYRKEVLDHMDAKMEQMQSMGWKVSDEDWSALQSIHMGVKEATNADTIASLKNQFDAIVARLREENGGMGENDIEALREETSSYMKAEWKAVQSFGVTAEQSVRYNELLVDLIQAQDSQGIYEIRTAFDSLIMEIRSNAEGETVDEAYLKEVRTKITNRYSVLRKSVEVSEELIVALQDARNMINQAKTMQVLREALNTYYELEAKALEQGDETAHYRFDTLLYMYDTWQSLREKYTVDSEQQMQYNEIRNLINNMSTECEVDEARAQFQELIAVVESGQSVVDEAYRQELLQIMETRWTDFANMFGWETQAEYMTYYQQVNDAKTSVAVNKMFVRFDEWMTNLEKTAHEEHFDKYQESLVGQMENRYAEATREGWTMTDDQIARLDYLRATAKNATTPDELDACFSEFTDMMKAIEESNRVPVDEAYRSTLLEAMDKRWNAFVEQYGGGSYVTMYNQHRNVVSLASDAKELDSAFSTFNSWMAEIEKQAQSGISDALRQEIFREMNERYSNLINSGMAISAEDSSLLKSYMQMVQKAQTQEELNSLVEKFDRKMTALENGTQTDPEFEAYRKTLYEEKNRIYRAAVNALTRTAQQQNSLAMLRKELQTAASYEELAATAEAFDNLIEEVLSTQSDAFAPARFEASLYILDLAAQAEALGFAVPEVNEYSTMVRNSMTYEELEEIRTQFDSYIQGLTGGALIDETLRKDTWQSMQERWTELAGRYALTDEDAMRAEELMNAVQKATSNDQIYEADRLFGALIREIEQRNGAVDEILRADSLKNIRSRWTRLIKQYVVDYTETAQYEFYCQAVTNAVTNDEINMHYAQCMTWLDELERRLKEEDTAVDEEWQQQIQDEIWNRYRDFESRFGYDDGRQATFYEYLTGVQNAKSNEEIQIHYDGFTAWMNELDNLFNSIEDERGRFLDEMRERWDAYRLSFAVGDELQMTYDDFRTQVKTCTTIEELDGVKQAFYRWMKMLESGETGCAHVPVVEEKYATCIEEGYRREYCANCGVTLYETSLPKLPHEADMDGVCVNCGMTVGEQKPEESVDVFYYRERMENMWNELCCQYGEAWLIEHGVEIERFSEYHIGMLDASSEAEADDLMNEYRGWLLQIHRTVGSDETEQTRREILDEMWVEWENLTHEVGYDVVREYRHAYHELCDMAYVRTSSDAIIDLYKNDFCLLVEEIRQSSKPEEPDFPDAPIRIDVQVGASTATVGDSVEEFLAKNLIGNSVFFYMADGTIQSMTITRDMLSLDTDEPFFTEPGEASVYLRCSFNGMAIDYRLGVTVTPDMSNASVVGEYTVDAALTGEHTVWSVVLYDNMMIEMKIDGEAQAYGTYYVNVLDNGQGLLFVSQEGAECIFLINEETKEITTYRPDNEKLRDFYYYDTMITVYGPYQGQGTYIALYTM
ncbi:MAG: hypothetical protein E7664_01270, partial [Ruminococcaceae bacterium]|nr:hypothetical protein [Oscillospiraceae bacterium]